MSIDPAKLAARQRTIALLTAGIAILLGALQLIFYLVGFEFDTGLYRHGPLPTLTTLLWTLAGASVVALSLTLPRKQTCQELCPPRSALSDYSALIAAISLVGVLLTTFAFGSNPADPLGTLLSSRVATDSTARTMLLLSMLLAIPSAIHFFLFFFKGINHPLGITAVLFFTAATALRVYFDMRYLLMSPQRILHLMALLSVMLFLIAELRMARGLCSRRLYFALSSLAAVFAFADAFCNLMLSLMSRQMLGSELTVYFFLLSMALFSFSRLLSFTYNESNREETKITLIYPEDDNTTPVSNEVSPSVASEESDQ